MLECGQSVGKYTHHSWKRTRDVHKAFGKYAYSVLAESSMSGLYRRHVCVGRVSLGKPVGLSRRKKKKRWR